MAWTQKLKSEAGKWLPLVFDKFYLFKPEFKKILKEKKLLKDLPEDIESLIKRSVAIRKHMERNKHDMTAKRGIQLTESKIKKLAKYYKIKGKLAEDWRYDRKTAEMLVD